jgi:alcohol dehydrogenase class IV
MLHLEKGKPIRDTFARKAASLISNGLRRTYQEGHNIEACYGKLLGALFLTFA